MKKLEKPLTTEQRKKFNNGCLYEISRMICIFLVVVAFLLGLPFLGSTVSAVAMNVFNIFGMILIARFIVGFIYPDEPLQKLRIEIEEQTKGEK